MVIILVLYLVLVWLVFSKLKLVRLGWFSGIVSLFQSGMIYRYASVMLVGIVVLTYWFLRR